MTTARAWCLALLLAALAAPTARGQEAQTWRHGVLEAKSDAGVVMMVGQGFAEKQGLKLDIVQFKSDIPALQALLAGELDSYEGGLGGAILAAAHGADIRIFGCYWGVMPQGLFVRDSIRSVADLKGRTIAISSPGSMPDLMIRAVLEKNNMAVSDVRLANLGSDLERFKALAAGVADGGVISGEFAPIAAKQGVKLLLPGREVLPQYLRFCLQSTAKTLAARRDDAVRFAAAEMAALHYALSHRDAAIALTRKLTGAHADDPRPAYVLDFVEEAHPIDPTLSIPLDKIAWMEEQLVKIGKLANPVDAASLVEPGIRARALARPAN